MHALLIKAQSRYGATRLFIDEIAAAFRRCGHRATVVDVADAADELAHLAATTEGQRFDLVYSIGLMGELRDPAGRAVSDVVQAPHVLQYVDYPLSHYSRLASTPPATTLLTVDPSHITAVRSVYGAERFPHVAFAPHGAIGEPYEPGVDAEEFCARRDIPLLFPATFYKPEPALWSKLDGQTRRVFDAAVEIGLGQEFVPALDALDQALAAHGGHLTPSSRAALRVNAFAVHEHIRTRRRFDLLKAAARAQLPLHVVGGEYARDLYRFRNVTHLGEQSLPAVIGLMRRSRVVLSSNANFGRGSHERPLTAMVAGAVAATDASEFYKLNFGDEAIFQYQWKRLDEGLEALVRLLEAPTEMFEMASLGHRLACAAHRWDHRVSTIIAAAEASRAAYTNRP